MDRLCIILFLPLCKGKLVSSLITLLLALPWKADLFFFLASLKTQLNELNELNPKDPNQTKEKTKTRTITQCLLDISEPKVWFWEWVHFGEREACKMSVEY